MQKGKGKGNKNKESMDMQQKPKDNADERNHYIRMAFNALPDADKVLNNKVLEKTREIIKDTVQSVVTAKLATAIANKVQLKHINEYMASIEAIRAPPPSQSSSSSSSSSSGARRLDTRAVIDAALK